MVGVTRYYILLEPVGPTKPWDDLLLTKLLRNYVHYLTNLLIQGHLTHLTTVPIPGFAESSILHAHEWNVALGQFVGVVVVHLG